MQRPDRLLPCYSTSFAQEVIPHFCATEIAVTTSTNMTSRKICVTSRNRYHAMRLEKAGFEDLSVIL